MDGDERNRVLFGIRAALDLACSVLPIGMHVARERPQAADVIGAGHFEKQVDIGKRPLGAGPKALGDLGVHVETGDPVREQHIRRGRPCPLGEGLKNLEDATREVVPDMVEIGPQSEIR